MEVHIDLAAGGERPTAELQDTFVSIRVGKERRQGRFTGARKVSFSAAAGQERSCRVDVFRHMGSGYVKLSGGDSEVADVEVPMGSPSLPRVRWRLSVRRDAQAATPIERQKRTQQRRDAAHEYWTKHHLDTELADIIRHLLRERPENPRAFLSSSIRTGALSASALDCGEGGIAEDDLTSGQEDGPVSPQRAPAPGLAAEEVRTDEPLLGAAAEPGVTPVHTATGSAVPPEGIQALAPASEEPQEARPQRPGTPVVDTAVEPQMVLATERELCSPARSPEPVGETLSTEAPAPAEPQETVLHRPGTPVVEAALAPQLGLATESELCSPAESPEPAEETLSTKALSTAGPHETVPHRPGTPVVDAALEPQLELAKEHELSSPAQSPEPAEETPSTEAPARAEPQETALHRPGAPAADAAFEPQLGLATESKLCSPALSPEAAEETLSTKALAPAEPHENALHRPGAPVADTALEPQLGLVTESELCSSPELAEETLPTKAPAPEGFQEAGEPRPGIPVADTAVEPQLGLATERELCSAARSPEPLEEALSTEAPAPEGPQEAGEPRPQTPVVDMAFEPQLGLATEIEFCSPEQSPEPVKAALSTEATAPERPQEARPPRPETPVVHAAPEPQLGLVAENGHCSPSWSPEPVEESEFTAYYRGHVLDLSLAWVPGLYEQFQATAPERPPDRDVAADPHLGLVESERCSPARSMEPAEDVASTEGLASTVPGSKEVCHVSEVVNEVLKAPLRPGSDVGVEVRSSVSAPGHPQERAKEQHAAPKQNFEKAMEEGLAAGTEENLAKHQPTKGASSPMSSLEAPGIPRRPRFPSTITAGSSIGPAESVWTVLVDSSAEASPSLSSGEDEGEGASHGTPLQRTQSDEYTIECFFLTELEPSEPSARAGDTTVGVADTVDDSAQWLTQKVLRGRQEEPLEPLEVNMVDVEMRGSRTVSRNSRKTVSPSPPGTPWIIKGLRPGEREETRRAVPEVLVERTGSDGSDSWRPSMPAASRASRASSSTAPVGPLPSIASNAVRLRVTIERAMNLRNADWLSLSDPYCILDVRGDKPKKFQTKVIEDNLHPVWEESYDFDYISPLPLEFRLFDKDFGKTDDFLGRATLTHDMFWPDGFDGHVVLEDARKTDGKDAVLFLKVHRIPSST